MIKLLVLGKLVLLHNIDQKNNQNLNSEILKTFAVFILQNFQKTYGVQFVAHSILLKMKQMLIIKLQEQKAEVVHLIMVKFYVVAVILIREQNK